MTPPPPAPFAAAAAALWDEWAILTAARDRFPGTAGEVAAREHVVAQLERLDVAIELHEHPYLGWALDGPVTLALTAPQARPLDARAFIYSGPTPPGGVAGTLEPVGEHWVIGLYRWPKLRIRSEAGETVGYVSGRPDGPAIPQPLAEGSSDLPHFIVGAEDLRAIDAALAAGAAPAVAGTLPSRLDPHARATNVVARLAGRDPAAPRLALCAHLDSVYGCPGANDNAGGLIGVLQLARHYAAAGSPRPLDFVFLAGEEWELFGSKAYVADHAGTPALSELAAMVNLDGIAEANEQLQIWSGPEELERRLHDAIEPYEEALGSRMRRTYVSPPPPGSDHMPFLALGIPAVMLTGWEMERYHGPADVMHEPGAVSIAHITDLTRHVVDTVDWDGLSRSAKRALLDARRAQPWEHALALKQY